MAKTTSSKQLDTKEVYTKIIYADYHQNDALHKRVGMHKWMYKYIVYIKCVAGKKDDDDTQNE